MGLPKISFKILICALSFINYSHTSKGINLYTFDEDPQEYTKAIKLAKDTHNRRELGSLIYDYAQKGVGGALVSFYDICPEDKRQLALYQFAQNGNVSDFWWAHLGKHASDRHHKESLFCYRQISDDFFKTSEFALDALFNYASVLAAFGDPKTDLDRAMKMAFEWRNRTPDLPWKNQVVGILQGHLNEPQNDMEFLKYLYTIILGRAREENNKKVINDFFIHTSNPRDLCATAVFANMGLIDWIDPHYIHESQGVVIHVVDPKKAFDPEGFLANITRVHEENIDTVLTVVNNALALILQEPHFKNFYRTNLGVENLNNITQGQIRDWAWEIVFKKQEALRSYDGQYLALKSILEKTDNVTLLEHVIKSLNELLGIE